MQTRQIISQKQIKIAQTYSANTVQSARKSSIAAASALYAAIV